MRSLREQCRPVNALVFFYRVQIPNVTLRSEVPERRTVKLLSVQHYAKPRSPSYLPLVGVRIPLHLKPTGCIRVVVRSYFIGA